MDFTYNDAGQLATIARFADLDALDPVAESEYTYDDDLGWLTSLVHTINDTNETITYGYTYEDDGKIDTIDLVRRCRHVRLRVRPPGPVDRRLARHRRRPDGHRALRLRRERQPRGVHGQRDHQHLHARGVQPPRIVDDGTDVRGFVYDDEGNTILKFIDVDESGNLQRRRPRRSPSTRGTTATGWCRSRPSTTTSSTGWTTRTGRSSTATISSIVLVVRSVDGVPEYFVYDGDSLATDRAIGELAASEDGEAPFGPDPAIDLGQVVLQLDGNAAPTHRYLWGQAVDQILADETVDDGSPEDVLWTLDRPPEHGPRHGGLRRRQWRMAGRQPRHLRVVRQGAERNDGRRGLPLCLDSAALR